MSSDVVNTLIDYLQATLTDYNSASRVTRGTTIAKSWVLHNQTELLSNNKNFFPVIMVDDLDTAQGDQVGVGSSSTIDTATLIATVYVPRDVKFTGSSLMGTELAHQLAEDIVNCIRTNWKLNIDIDKKVGMHCTGSKARPPEWDAWLFAHDVIIQVIAEDIGS